MYMYVYVYIYIYIYLFTYVYVCVYYIIYTAYYIYITYIYICVCLCVWLTVDLKVHVEIVHYKGRQGNMRPHESVFSEFANVFFGATDLAKDLNMRPPRKINVGFVKDSQQ